MSPQLDVNDQLNYFANPRLQYNLAKDTILSRDNVHNCDDSFGGTIAAWQREKEQVVKQLLAFASRARHVTWFGDVPLANELMRLGVLFWQFSGHDWLLRPFLKLLKLLCRYLG